MTAADIQVGMYVIVDYEGSLFPEQVAEMAAEGAGGMGLGAGAIVSCMVRSGKAWRWPEVLDMGLYTFRDILATFDGSIIQPLSKSARCSYRIPHDLLKTWDE